jgi:hypothetical protein
LKLEQTLSHGEEQPERTKRAANNERIRGEAFTVFLRGTVT